MSVMMNYTSILNEICHSSGEYDSDWMYDLNYMSSKSLCDPDFVMILWI